MFQKLKFKEANDKQLEAIKSIDGIVLLDYSIFKY